MGGLGVTGDRRSIRRFHVKPHRRWRLDGAADGGVGRLRRLRGVERLAQCISFDVRPQKRPTVGLGVTGDVRCLERFHVEPRGRRLGPAIGLAGAA